MIVRMVKVEIVGPKELLFDAIDAARHLGVLHLESDPQSAAGPDQLPISSLQLSENGFEERLFFEELADKISTLLKILPPGSLRKSTLQPLPVLDIIATKAEKHLSFCRQQRDRLTELADEEKELDAFRGLLQTIEPMLSGIDHQHRMLDIFGLSFKDQESFHRLSTLLEELFDGEVVLTTADTAAGDRVGIVAIATGAGARLRSLLETENVPELDFPEEFKNGTFVEKVHYLSERLRQIDAERARIKGELTRLGQSWRPIYQQVYNWLSQQLDILEASAAVFETGMCFIIIGWLPQKQLERMQSCLEQRFKGRVTLESIAIMESDLERIPVALMNPRYFKPFERMTALLPLPRYSSFDPTPFLGIFFPLFFGMMLGDIGYGLILILFASGLLMRNGPPLLLDAARILGACGLLTMLFGGLYGELLGDWGSQALGLQPLFFERSHAIVPMLYFSLSVGGMHILLGLVLKTISSCRHHLWKEGVLKFLEIIAILGLSLLFVTFLWPETGLEPAPFLLLISIAVPAMILLGGLLAPLELLKTVGNIVSYARIMAIGTTSVLLAVIANRLGGMTGDVIAGLLVAGLLHTFNLILGVFAPTIHALRLHYVEFFSKFLEVGGRRFAPLDKKEPD
ncbi:MAG: ATPase [Desulfuromonadales bacterium]|nr:ATPase [Desulfuromonadales bacterium]